jgi:hypothetical protein
MARETRSRPDAASTERAKDPSSSHSFSPLPSPGGRGKRGRGVGVRGFVETVEAREMLTPGIVKLLLPPGRPAGNSHRD